MEKKELYLKTVFCCMACDGDIAKEEVDMVRELCSQNGMFEGMNSEEYINRWISDINADGSRFLSSYLNDVSNTDLTTDEQLLFVDLAIKTIEADNKIEYSEVKFFKKIRFRLSVSDEAILARHPNKEDFLLPDITVKDTFNLENVAFSTISLSLNS